MPIYAFSDERFQMPLRLIARFSRFAAAGLLRRATFAIFMLHCFILRYAFSMPPLLPSVSPLDIDADEFRRRRFSPPRHVATLMS